MIDAKSLTGIGFLDGLSASDREKLAAICQIVTFKKGDKIFSRGDRGENFYIVKKGKVNLCFRISVLLADEDVVVDEKEEGDTLGWSALVGPHKLTLSAYCSVDCELIRMEGAQVLSLCGEEHHMGFVLMTNLAKVIASRMDRFQFLFEKEVERNVPSFEGKSKG
ncbi:MAG: Crp/Fnr family transcriptional regulator [Bacteroidota bacterium]